MHIPSTVLSKLKKLLGPQHVQTGLLPLALNSYDCSSSAHRPDVVLQITSAKQLEPIIRLLADAKIPFIARAAATNHAGSCSAVKGGVVLNLNALNQLYMVNTEQGFAEADPCLVNGRLQEVLSPLNFFYAPDPASEQVCTLGGNLAQNASGARCMKYGNTADNTLQIKFIAPNGKTHTLTHDDFGPDFLGLVAGSEGTLGIIEKMRVRILPIAKQIQTFLIAFTTLEDCVQTVTDLVSEGLSPRCVEAMDRFTIQTIESFCGAGYPDAEALLIVELDGSANEIKKDIQTLEKIYQKNNGQLYKQAKNELEREQIWSSRRTAYAALAAWGPNVAVADGTVPRSELPRALALVRQIIQKYGLQASLLFHAGDGNFHPQIVFDSCQPIQTRLVHQAMQEILKTCVDRGGTISGEHGIGIEKRVLMTYQYSRETLGLFKKIKTAFDPYNLANPDKIIPIGFEDKACAHVEKDLAVSQLAQEIKHRFEICQSSRITSKSTADKKFISTAGLDKILEIDKANYVAVVQAGVPVKTVIETLRKQHGYAHLPSKYDGTIGRLIATKAVPEFVTQLVGIQAILPNGDIVQYGGKFMKNAAGYNLCRLFAGSWGALGVITQLTFKIYTSQPSVTLKNISLGQPNDLFNAVKQTLDPTGLFISPAFQKESQ